MCKILIHNWIFAGLLILSITGCTTDTEEVRTGSGQIVPLVSIDPAVYAANGQMMSGVISSLPEASDMQLRVTSANGEYSATWPSVSEYALNESYRPATYVVEAFSNLDVREGFDMPCFYGVSPVIVESGASVNADVRCSLVSAVFDVNFSERFTSAFTSACAVIHCEGGQYFKYATDETRRLFVRGGRTSILLSLVTLAGESIEFEAAEVDDALMQHYYSISLDAKTSTSGNPIVVVSFDDATSATDKEIELTPEFIASTVPEIVPVGFATDVPLIITEGDIPSAPIGISLDGPEASSLMLTVQAPSLISRGWPEEIDLVRASTDMIAMLQSLGLKITRVNGSVTAVDLTDALPLLRAYDKQATFSFVASSSAGKVNGPVTLSVDVRPAEFNVISMSDVVMGLDMLQITLLSSADNIKSNLSVEVLSPGSSTWSNAEIVAVDASSDAPGEWNVIAKVPSVTSASLDVRLNYCGNEVARRTVGVVSPVSVNTVDAFARIAVIKIESEMDDMLQLIVKNSKVYVNGSLWQALTRQPDKGLIILGGLTPSTKYEIKTTLYDNPSAVTAGNPFSNTVTVETEKAAQLPNNSFEDVTDGINYKNLPSGGRYSQNIVDIYNQQNYTSFSGYVPKSWANVNVKTFATSARNHNTWYMYPSTTTITDATDGAYAVCLQTTSFDLDGPSIPDYRQEGTPYINYSKNIPKIAWKAAGKLFLGEYGFDPATMEEVYKEGHEFNSRPTSLNGYYRFIPSIADLNDSGLVQIEVIGNRGGADIVISRATLRLTSTSGYKAFSVPLTYDYFGIKANRIKVMISSSASVGSIAHETETIKTYPDPVTSTSLGGMLWIDNLTFTY